MIFHFGAIKINALQAQATSAHPKSRHMIFIAGKTRRIIFQAVQQVLMLR